MYGGVYIQKKRSLKLPRNGAEFTDAKVRRFPSLQQNFRTGQSRRDFAETSQDPDQNKRAKDLAPPIWLAVNTEHDWKQSLDPERWLDPRLRLAPQKCPLLCQIPTLQAIPEWLQVIHGILSFLRYNCSYAKATWSNILRDCWVLLFTSWVFRNLLGRRHQDAASGFLGLIGVDWPLRSIPDGAVQKEYDLCAYQRGYVFDDESLYLRIGTIKVMGVSNWVRLIM